MKEDNDLKLKFFLQINYFIRRHWLILLIFMFFISRLFMAYWLAPHNDEVIYTRYAQLISQNWQTNKYISVDGSFLGDYKEPFQYWLTALTVNFWSNPLWGVRIWSIFFSTFGFVCFLLLLKDLFNRSISVLTGLLIIFSGYYLYFDVLGLAEPYVYGLGASYLYFFWRWLERKKVFYFIISSCLAILGLLTKSSFLLIFPLSIVILFFASCPTKNSRVNNRFIGLASLLFQYFLARGVYFLVIPNRFTEIKKTSPAAQALLSWQEIVRLPYEQWWSNLHFYFVNVVFVDNLMFVWLGIFGLFIWFLSTKRTLLKSDNNIRYFLLAGSLFLLSFLPIVVVAKNHYVRYYGMWLMFLYLLIAVVLLFLKKELLTQFKRMPAVMSVIFLSILLINQSVQSFYPAVKYYQTDYGEEETSESWASPLGVKEFLKIMRDLPPGIIFHMNNWGHIGADISVFKKQLNQLSFVILNSQAAKETVDDLDHLVAATNVYSVFDTRLIVEQILFLDTVAKKGYVCGNELTVDKVYKFEKKSSQIIICQIKKR